MILLSIKLIQIMQHFERHLFLELFIKHFFYFITLNSYEKHNQNI